ncbi:MAG: hypothetical protein IID41_01045 [Planctomycetes bacterium]|nr:hypothetical protein [Planctomycetota bacterium]
MCRALDIITDDERKHKLVGEQVELTRRATEASERSADSAARSADAAEQSKCSAASIARTRWIMVGIAALTFILMLIGAMWK